MQVQWLARTLRYWNKLTGSVFVANVAAGLGCGRTNTWAAELRAALQFVCPSPDWTAHMLQCKPIEVEPVVAAAQSSFCSLLGAYTGAPEADACAGRTFCKYAKYMILGGRAAERTQLPTPAYVHAIAPLARKRALAQLRLSSTPLQSNTQREVCYSQRVCQRGCAEAVDSEYHLLFECIATADVRTHFNEAVELAGGDLGNLMGLLYHEEHVDSIMEFIYSAANTIPGPIASSCVLSCVIIIIPYS
jgi:hypothetical protein